MSIPDLREIAGFGCANDQMPGSDQLHEKPTGRIRRSVKKRRRPRPIAVEYRNLRVNNRAVGSVFHKSGDRSEVPVPGHVGGHGVAGPRVLRGRSRPSIQIHHAQNRIVHRARNDPPAVSGERGALYALG